MSDLSAVFGAGFDTDSVPPQGDYEVLPPGKYPVLIEKAEVKQTKAGTGILISLEMCVLDGPGKNRKLFDNINIQNPSQQCVEIGLRTLAALGKALGLNAIANTDQLLNQACIACVKVKDGQNNIRTYEPISGQPMPSSPVQQPAQQHTLSQPPAQNVAGPVATGNPPWMRK